MSTKNTPGPWEVNPLGAESESNLIFASKIGNGKRRLIASVTTGADAPANRRLIAAAPNLLEALRNTASMLRSACLVITDKEARQIALETLTEANAAIAKATGEA